MFPGLFSCSAISTHNIFFVVTIYQMHMHLGVVISGIYYEDRSDEMCYWLEHGAGKLYGNADGFQDKKFFKLYPVLSVMIFLFSIQHLHILN